MSTDLHALLAPYALDALPDDERREFEHHLIDCEQCAAELDGFVETAARLGSAASGPVPARLRDSVLAAAASTPQVRPLTRPHRRPTWQRRVQRGLLAAAALVLVVGVGGFIVERQHADDLERRETAMSQVLAAPDVQTSSQELAGGGTVTVARSERLDRAVVALADLPPAEADRVYQLWVIRGATPQPRDTFDRAGSSSHLVRDVDADDALAITVEPEGGSERPTTDPLVVVNA